MVTLWTGFSMSAPVVDPIVNFPAGIRTNSIR
jgi:hypothetical protein